MDNPCVTLPISENWLADYSNSRCYRNYLYDSGWIYNEWSSLTIKESSFTDFFWNGTQYRQSSTTTQFNSSGYTYYKGSFVRSFLGQSYFKIKRTQPRTEYKSFSSF